MSTTKRITITGLIIFFGSFVLNAQDESQCSSLLFQENEKISVKIETDFKTLFKDDKDVREYHTGKIKYEFTPGTTDSLDIILKVRGNFRRKYCNFPPLMLKPADSMLIAHPFFGTDGKIKLVTHCKTRSKSYEQYILQEYLVYRLYNIFTDYSYRVRLVDVTYVDVSEKFDSIQFHAFFIESTKMMLTRLQMKKVKALNVPQFQLNRELMGQLAVFQYLIGNTDWSTGALHNVKLIRKDPFVPPIAVPYDFDWAGIINTPYAKPVPHLGITDVRERLFRGFCRTDQEFQQIFDIFNEKREEIYALYNDADFLTEKKRNETISYLNEFYNVINSPKLIEREFKNNCKERN